jgi:hypothetical protein
VSTLAKAPPVATREPPSRRTAERRLDALILAAIVAVSVAVQYAFASSSFFFQDDWGLFHQSLAGGLDPGTLTKAVEAHFAPGHRVLDFIVTRYLPHFHEALALLLCFHAVSIVLMQRILALMFGRKWWTFALAFAFGLSMIYAATLWWWASAAHAIPAVTFSLASVHGYLAWRQTGRWGWLAWSLAALCIGLLFYIETILVPVYLFLLSVLILRPDERLVNRIRAAAREWRIWLLYAVSMAAIAIVWVVGGYSSSQLGQTNVSLIPEYLRLAWTDGFVPPIFGVGLTSNEFSQWIALLGEVAVLVAFGVSLMRRSTAWKAWLFLAIGFVLTALMVTSRLGPFGVIVASQTRYYTETALLVPIALAAAFAVPRRLDPARSAASSVAPMRPPRPAIAVLAALALAANVALVAFADHGFVDNRAYANKTWVHNLELGVALARFKDPRPVLLDTRVPLDITAPFNPAEGLLSYVSVSFLHDVRFSAVAPHTFAVGPDGGVRQVAFVRSAGGDLATLRHTGEATLTGAAWSRERGDTCVTGGASAGTLQVQSRTPLRGREWWVRATYRTPPGVGLRVALNTGVGYPPNWTPRLRAAPVQRSALLRVDPLPTGVPTLGGIRILVPARTKLCFGPVELGWFRVQG